MSTLSKTQTYLYILSCLFIFISCEKKTPKKEVVYGKDTLCECSLTELEMAEKYPITSIGDSIVLCKIGSINNKTWIDFLSENTLNSPVTIFNCKNNETFNPKYGTTTISYKNKSLIVNSNRYFTVYDSINDEWVQNLQVDVYTERIYVANGKIVKSKEEIILNPPKYNQKAIDEVHRLFELKKKKPHTVYIKKYLFVAALNGDSLSRERLLTFETIFPDDHEINETNREVEILTDFEDFISKGGQLPYLDLTLYPRFKPRKQLHNKKSKTEK